MPSKQTRPSKQISPTEQTNPNNQTNPKESLLAVDQDENGSTAHARNEAEPILEKGDELEFESMDLSVESVEERISPSETNVFDK